MFLTRGCFFSILLSFSLFLNGFAQVCSKTQLAPNLQQGLVAYYPFCNNYADVSGNNFIGVTQGGAVPFVADRQGNPNGAVQLGGGFITTSAAVFNFQRNQSFSVSIWFTKDNNAPSGRLLSNECPEGNFRIGASFNGVYAVQYGDYIFDTVNIGQWNHLVYTYENRIEKVYVNGKLKYTNNDLTNEALNFCAPLTIGAKASSAFDRWVGKADDLAIYNRVLSESEVRQLFTNANCSGNLVFDVFNDTTNAIGVSTILDAGSGFATYSWNTGATTKSIEVNSNGFYKVTVTDQFGCTASDSTYLNLFYAQIQQNDTAVCPNSTVLLEAKVSNIFGDNWTRISNQTDSYTRVVKLSNGKYLAAAQLNSRLYSSSDLSSFIPFPSNLLTHNLSFGIDKFGTLYYGTSHDGVFKSVNNGLSWEYSVARGFGCGNLDFQADDDNVLYTSIAGFLRGLFVSKDNGVSWINTFSGRDFTDIESLAGFNKVFITTSGNIWSTSNKGTTWNQINNQPFSTNTILIKSFQGKVYVCTNTGEMYSSVDGGTTWNYLSKITLQATPSIYLNDFIFVNDRIWFASIDKNGIFRSEDGGKTWRSVSNGLSGDSRYLFYDNNTLVATTSNGIYKLGVNQSKPSYKWSTGDTTNAINVSPKVTTKYYLTVSTDKSTITDSVLISVSDISSFNPLPDTISQCGITAKLDAGTKYSSYSWSNGESTPAIDVNIGGRYFVTVKDTLGCSASDSTYLSLVNANILQNDTIICNGGTINLSVDTVYKVINTLGTTLPINLKNDLVAYYPFNSNANDESGNGNHATVYNARLTTDRFGRANSAYSFSPTSKSSIIPGVLNTTMVNSFTYSVWVKPLNTIIVPPQGQASNAASGFPNNTCVIHPIHGQNYGPENLNTGTGVYVGTNGVYLEEHSAGWEAVPISHQTNLTGWHLINIVYENKVPTLYIDGVFIKKGVPSPRQIYASLGPDRFPTYDRSGIGAGYIPGTGTTQYFNGDIDDIFYYKRALSANEVNQIYNGALNVKWSTGDTTSKITVSPSVTTKYFVTVSDGITTCTDSILVKVDNVSDFNPLPDTISQCGKSVVLDAGEDFQTYNWSNGATTQSISVTQGGRYNVNVKTADGCSASDTTVVSLVYVNIDNRDTIVCAPVNIKLQITDTLVSKKGGWELLIPSSSFNFSETNFREGGFDAENAKLYSILKNGSVNRFYVFDLNTNSVQTLESNSPPGEVYDYVYDFTNSRILGTRVGRDRMFNIPLTGGTWTPYGNGNFDAESYGCATYWNPVSRRPGFFGGYGFFSVKNWVWENNGNGGWQNVFANTNNCQPPKRTGQIARNKLGDKLYIFSGQGSCDGNQFASSCSISQPWATDVGVFCWLKDLWELDLNNYTFKNILPPNSPSIVNEGGFAYDYNGDVFYNVGGYKPLPTHSPATAANLDYAVEVYRYRRGLDNGFELLPVDGIKPPVLKLSQYSGRTYFDAKNNRIIWARNDGIWALNLGATGSASYKYKWSTGDSTTSITVSPTKTTTYYVNVTDGITTCSDSVTVTVEQPTNAIRYPTQDIIVNRPTELAARKFGRTYLWNPDVQLNSPRLSTPIITATKQQQYTIRITTDAGCVTVDTVLVRVFPDRNIYVPEGFTPDADGRNDRLYPIPIGIREMRTFRVYNRWGTLLYDNKNANINNGWDGTYLGTAQPMESYVWVAEGIDIDGKFIRRTGNAILIR